jgi:nitrosocyanin
MRIALDRIIGVSTAVVLALGCAVFHPAPASAGEVTLTVVNVETPQGVKVWMPESIFAKKGDTVKLKLINKLDAEHGFKIAGVGVEKVVAAQATEEVTFKAEKAGIYPISCQLHPPHVAVQLVVLE